MTTYCVQTLSGGVWTIRRYRRLADAVRFRNSESKRLMIGLAVVRVDADLTCYELGGSGAWHRV